MSDRDRFINRMLGDLAGLKHEDGMMDACISAFHEFRWVHEYSDSSPEWIALRKALVYQFRRIQGSERVKEQRQYSSGSVEWHRALDGQLYPSECNAQVNSRNRAK